MAFQQASNAICIHINNIRHIVTELETFWVIFMQFESILINNWQSQNGFKTRLVLRRYGTMSTVRTVLL